MPDWIGWLSDVPGVIGGWWKWEAADVVVTGLFAAAAYWMARKTARLAETDQTPLIVVQHHGGDDYRVHNSGRGAAINVVAVIPRPFAEPTIKLLNPIGAGEHVPFLEARDVDSLEPIRIYYQRLTSGTTGGAHWFVSHALTKSLSPYQRRFAHSVDQVGLLALPSGVVKAVSTLGTLEFLKRLQQWWRPSTFLFNARNRLPVRLRSLRARCLRWWHRTTETSARHEFLPSVFPLEVMSEEERMQSPLDISGPLMRSGGVIYQHAVNDHGEHLAIIVSVAPHNIKGVVVARKDLVQSAGSTRQERGERVWEAFRRDFARRRPADNFAYVYLWRL